MTFDRHHPLPEVERVVGQRPALAQQAGVVHQARPPAPAPRRPRRRPRRPRPRRRGRAPAPWASAPRSRQAAEQAVEVARAASPSPPAGAPSAANGLGHGPADPARRAGDDHPRARRAARSRGRASPRSAGARGSADLGRGRRGRHDGAVRLGAGDRAMYAATFSVSCPLTRLPRHGRLGDVDPALAPRPRTARRSCPPGARRGTRRRGSGPMLRRRRAGVGQRVAAGAEVRERLLAGRRRPRCRSPPQPAAARAAPAEGEPRPRRGRPGRTRAAAHMR